MIGNLIWLLVVGIVLVLIFIAIKWGVKYFMGVEPNRVVIGLIGLVLLLIWIGYALQMLGIAHVGMPMRG